VIRVPTRGSAQLRFAPPLAVISSRLRRLEFASRIEDAGAPSSSIPVFTEWTRCGGTRPRLPEGQSTRGHGREGRPRRCARQAGGVVLSKGSVKILRGGLTAGRSERLGAANCGIAGTSDGPTRVCLLATISYCAPHPVRGVERILGVILTLPQLVRQDSYFSVASLVSQVL
jgi:hypothetical protein